VEAAWVTRKYYFRQRILVCSRINKRVERDVRNQEQIVDGIPPTDRWTDRKGESRTRAILENVH